MHRELPSKRKRARPTDETIGWRTRRLAELATLDGQEIPSPQQPLIEPGNKKTGLAGKFFRSICVWNLPPVVTCPGRSDWCMAYCYNADPRSDVYPVAKWMENLRLFEASPQEAEQFIVSVINAQEKPAAVRIHSSGDFYSIGYINCWINIVSECPDVRFWAYTRSWTDSTLLPALESLRGLPNVQLFASWDATMPRPPDGWRLSIISEGTNLSTANNLDCPEQYEGGPPCADCGYCIRKGAGNVIFHSH